MFYYSGIKIVHPASGQVIVESAYKKVSVNFGMLKQMEEKYMEDEKEDEKKEVYECQYEFIFSGNFKKFSKQVSCFFI
jgi:hypothetical protein